jgi:hypothetical protein
LALKSTNLIQRITIEQKPNQILKTYKNQYDGIFTAGKKYLRCKGFRQNVMQFSVSAGGDIVHKGIPTPSDCTETAELFCSDGRTR